MIDADVLALLHRTAHAERWRVDTSTFGTALETSAAKAFGGRTPHPLELRTYLTALHLQDLALACACAAGDEPAWQHFVTTYRPVMYRAAESIAGDDGRELADSLYGELFGITERGEARRSLFRYFHGRSGLATWLRALLAQRHVDGLRVRKRERPFPDDDTVDAIASRAAEPDPERSRFVVLMHAALTASLALLSGRDRLRLACYYAQQLTLAQVGRLTGEHEATVSRQLTRTRAALRESVEHTLRAERGLSDAEIAACFESIVADAGPLDLGELLGPASTGKEFELARSTKGRHR